MGEMKLNIKCRYVAVMCLIVVSIVGCTKREIDYESIADHKNFVESTEYGNINMEFSLLNGNDIRSFDSKRGKEYQFDYEYLVTEGSILLQFRDSEDKIIDEVLLTEDEYLDAVYNLESEHEGEVNLYKFGSNITIDSKDEKIKIVISGDNAKGRINISW
ncbi:MAG: hypothetical protein CVU95_12790 [Firmicutes bacterium HGW-Firmicutes-2]|jgi:hypothetical protein|nr:MAG: hypothetical protein CVU95_12790 [Firmicutes bacterium HGW-Firmicutes-2]